MAKDYASKSYKKKGGKKTPIRIGSKRKSKGKKPLKKQTRNTGKNKHFPFKCLIALITLIIVIIIVLIMFIKHPSTSNNEKTVPVSYASGEKISSTTSSNNAQEKVQLINHKVEITFQQQAQKVSGNVYYMLQLGRYDKFDPVLHVLKTQLKKAGVRFHQVKTMRNERVYYRIEIGPYYNTSSIEKARQKLYQKKIYAVIRKVVEQNDE